LNFPTKSGLCGEDVNWICPVFNPQVNNA